MPHTVITTNQPSPISSSYEEIVHAEPTPATDPLGVQSSQTSTYLGSILDTLAEWLLILQGVAEDRDLDLPPRSGCLKCRCDKAARITQEMSTLQREVSEAEEVVDRLGMLEEKKVEDLSERIHEMAVMLRSDVSILIPTDSPSNSNQWRGVNPSRWILQSLNGGGNTSSFILDELISVVTRLLGVDTCDSCNHHLMFCNEDGENNQLIASGDKSRKRKQRNPAKLTSPIFNRKTRRLDAHQMDDSTALDEDDPMVEEAEKAINILSLLEKKKKGLKKDGLYKFVLWREALKDEKSKMSV